ncbi:hypothetical protein [Halorussus aquaticus]|uniref:Uncharacterized protein n=1 Tax=Halorussus aquaticus TaxID=2953748 RepID=A0ABD5PWC6_9EURY|nr:hypothetical protein [Halorussus aquaticus]
MDRTVPLAFALLGVVLGAVGQLNSLAPALLQGPRLATLGPGVALLGGVLFLLSTVVVAWVGYRTGRRVDLPAEFGRFATTAGAAGGLGFLVGGAATLLVAPVRLDGFLVTVIFGVGYGAVTKGVSIGLYGLAGAAVGHFRRSRA